MLRPRTLPFNALSALSTSMPSRATRPASPTASATRFLRPAVLLIPSLLALGALPSRAQDAKESVRLAQAQTNTPAADPGEGRGAGQPRTDTEGLDVPADDNASPPVEPNGPAPADTDAATPTAPANPDAPTAPATGETPDAATVTPGAPGGTPATPGSLQPTEAEGQEIVDVRVIGNRVVPAATVLSQVTSRRGGAFSAVQVDRDRAKIDSLGFFASVQYQVTPNVDDPRKVDLAFVIVENRVVTGFRFVNSLATPEKPLELSVPEKDLIGVLDTKPGSILNYTILNSDIDKIKNLFRERGFFGLVVQPPMPDDRGVLTFSVQQATVSDVIIEGLKKTRPGLVRRQIRVGKGDVFDENKLRRDLNRIYDLGFFEDVSRDIQDDTANPGQVIVKLQLKERRTGQFTFGLGFDSRSKLTGFLTLAENNLRGSGKRAFGSVEAGATRSFDIGFGDPFVGQNNSSYDIGVFSRRIFREPRSIARVLGTGAVTDGTQVFNFEEERTGGRLNYSLPLDRDRTKKVLFGYRNERASLFQSDGVNVIRPVDLPTNATGRISAFSAGFLRDRRDLQTDPSRGGREQIIVERAFSFLGGSQAFTKLDLDVRRYLPLLRGQKAGDLPRLVAANRLVIGQSFGQLPAFEQYFIGGTETVRGYDVDTQLGDNQFYNNFELRFRFQRKFQIVGFIDVGRATGGRFATADELLYSVGAGVRLQTPLGPIRLDIGSGRDGIRTHFAIGPSF